MATQPIPAAERYTFDSDVVIGIPDAPQDGIESRLAVDADGLVEDLSVEVDIEHTYIGDLTVSLTSPDGHTALLHNRRGAHQDNLVHAWTPADTPALAALAGVPMAGEWRLRVRDMARLDVGRLRRWTLTVTPRSAHRAELADSPGATIRDADSAGLTRSLACEAPGNIRDIAVEVDIAHPYIGDLTVHLVAPSGRRVVLHDRAGGAADNITRRWTSSTHPSLLAALLGEPARGTWTLQVADHAARDTGRLNQWRVLLGLTAPPAETPYDLGPLPPELEIRWPAPPVTEREVEIGSVPAGGLRLEQPGTRILIATNVADLTVAASDIEVRMADGVRIEHVFIDKEVKRLRFQGGRYGEIVFRIPASFDPDVWHSEWMIEDVLFDGVEVERPVAEHAAALLIRGRRVAVVRSRVRVRRYSVWIGDTVGFANEDIILAGNDLHSGGESVDDHEEVEATVRIQPVHRAVVVENRLTNTVKHNYRVHGQSDLVFAARNTLVNAGVKMALEARDALGTIWLQDNVFHQTLDSLLGLDNPPGSEIERLIATGNRIFTSRGHECFVCANPLPSGWEDRDNVVTSVTPPTT